MKISLQWLKTYVDIKVPSGELARKITFAGLDVSSSCECCGDTVFEIEITSNRPDWLSHIGVAREISAITGRKLKPLPIDKLKPKTKNPAHFKIEIQDKSGCPRYTGRIIRNLKIAPSPGWMAKRLTRIGARTVNNGADITNYCLFETGQPMHAFDLDKLEGNKVIVRRAKKGESIVTIDGVKRELDDSILIIADAKKPVAIAGIMGGLDTEVTDKTKNILLESAYFDPVTIRRASRKLGLSTESNYRFERNVDIDNVVFSSQRAALLYKEVTGADTSAPCIDINYTKKKILKIDADWGRLKQLIGAPISKKEIKDILKALGFGLKENKGKFQITVPVFRRDMRIFEDVVEEVARIWGYERIQQVMPKLKAHIEPAKSALYQAKEQMRKMLTGQGLNEVITYTLLSSKNLDEAKAEKQNRVVIQNPLSAQQELMRNSMLVSLLKVINTNLNRKVKEIKIFELGKVYKHIGKNFTELEQLAVALVGTSYNNWKDRQRGVNFHDLKGIVESVFGQFGITSYKLKIDKNNPCFAPDECAVFISDAKEIAVLGKVNGQILKNFDITEENVYFAQLPVSLIATRMKTEYKYTPVSRYPSVIRDIALVVSKDISAQSALDIIQEIAAGLAVKIELFDLYTGNQIPRDSKSLAFSIEYQSRKSTLTEEEVNKVHSEILAALTTRLKAALR